jgi:PIN domain nuclease of toxin-antitoxin system
MKLLLDTHAVYWWMIEEKRLSLKVRKALQSRVQIFVSPARV